MKNQTIEGAAKNLDVATAHAKVSRVEHVQLQSDIAFLVEKAINGDAAIAENLTLKTRIKDLELLTKTQEAKLEKLKKK